MQITTCSSQDHSIQNQLVETPKSEGFLKSLWNLTKIFFTENISFYRNHMWDKDKKVFFPIKQIDCKIIKIVLITKPEWIKKILQTEQRGKKAPLNGGGFVSGVIETVGQNNLFTVDRSLHDQLRQLFFHSLKPSQLGQYTHKIAHITEDFLKELSHESVCSPLPLLQKFTLNTLVYSLLDHSTKEEDHLYPSVAKLVETLGKLTRRIPAKQLSETKNTIKAVVDQIINKAMESHAKDPTSESPKSFIHQMVIEMEKGKVSRGQLEEMLYVMFGAGMETTASALNSVLYNLGQHPQWQEILRDEISALGEMPLEDKFKATPQMDRFIKEVFRLYPPVWGQGRGVSESFELEGHLIPKDSVILMMYLFSQTDPSRWTNPLVFDPNRFNPAFQEQFPLTDTHNLFHFSVGRDDCIGRFFASHVIKTFIFVLLSHYHIRDLSKNPQLKEGALAMYLDQVKIELQDFV